MEARLEELTGDIRLIADELGIETANALLEAFAGCYLYIPSRLPQTLARHVNKQHEQGLSCKRIAQNLGLSERYIQRILAKKRIARPSEPQRRDE